MTHEKRLVLPPGTQLVLTPTLAMPLMRYPPHGIDANFTISTPFTSKYFQHGVEKSMKYKKKMPGFGTHIF